MEFIIDNISVIVKKEDNESDDIFFDRGKFIINNYNKIKNMSFEKLISLSKIYTYIKYNKCTYNKDVTNLINSMLKY